MQQWEVRNKVKGYKSENQKGGEGSTYKQWVDIQIIKLQCLHKFYGEKKTEQRIIAGV